MALQHGVRHTARPQVLAHRDAGLARTDDDYFGLFAQRSASTQGGRAYLSHRLRCRPSILG
ncbi:hypothetical protein SXIM_02200 [Streptomyces xiamenensis]|uniref:Uncharacterized protein n=1 Tax=Streptomyces xiamenensis TaxID=408015 RepID=A0A0F7FPB1_9ACTN|nr:hypothetical protein SXIM_02200 [Streptomyces xiamenensis]